MKLAGSLLLALVIAGCGGRQSKPAPAEPAPRVAANHAVQAAPAEAAEPSPPSPPSPTAEVPPPPPEGQKAVFAPSAADQIFLRRMLDFIDEVAVVMEAHQNACDRMATELELIVRRNQDLIGQGKAMKADAAREQWLSQQAMPRLEKAMPKMMTGLQNCQGNTRLQALMRQLGS